MKGRELAIAAVLLVFPALLFAADMQVEARGIYGLIRDKYGTTRGVRDNIDAPMTGQDILMTTVDGSSSFDASLTCPESDSFLEVSCTVSGTGELSVQVVQDLDMDSSPETSFSVSGVSGVCLNGVVLCDPGTWANCAYRRWVALPGGKVSLVGAPLSEMGGCFCTNSSCGYDHSDPSMVGRVLEALGGGIVGAVNTASGERYAVTAVSEDLANYRVSYTGQDTQGCSGESPHPSGFSSVYDPSDDSMLANRAFSEWGSAASDPDSAAFQITHLSTTGNVHNCYIENEVTASPVRRGECTLGLKHLPFDRNSCDHGYVNAECVDTDGDGYGDTFRFTGDVWDCDGDCGNQIFDAQPVSIDLRSFPGSAYLGYFKTHWSGGCYTRADITLLGTCDPSNLCNYTVVIDNPGYWHGELHIAGEGVLEDDLSVHTTNTCSAYESDPDCSLMEETVDGVKTVSDYNRTGSFVPAKCSTVSGVYDHVVCSGISSFRDISFGSEVAIDPSLSPEARWMIERTYVCRSGDEYDLTQALERSKEVDSTAVNTGSNMTYSDSGTSYTYLLPSVPGVSPCTYACKVERQELDTTEFSDTTNRTQATRDPTTNRVVIRTCVKADGAYECPLKEGEVLLEGCGCLDEFNEATAAVKVLEEASKDLICAQQ